MYVTENITATLRAQMEGHPPLVLGSQQGGAEICEDLCPAITSAAGTSGNNQPVLFENHGIDSRYTGPYDVSPTISARAGTGGNNLPLVSQNAVPSGEECGDTQQSETYCIAGNIIDRQDHNGGNGFGYQPDISYTLNTADRHCVFSQQRSDEYVSNDVVSTQSARQYKDSTDLVCDAEATYQDTIGALCESDKHGIGSQYVDQDKSVVEAKRLIRRLTPLECERLQGFPDYWTDIPGASDSARYKALGNSVAIPCVENVLRGSLFLCENSMKNRRNPNVHLPRQLKSKAVLWLWQLRDIGVIGVGLLLSVFALAQLKFLPPVVITALYAFLTIRFDDTSILDFIKYACAFFITKQQAYEWGYGEK
jgi:DNA (cytosine-5)-methyltransferase 1